MRKLNTVFARRRVCDSSGTSNLRESAEVKIRPFLPGDVDFLLRIQNACKGIAAWRKCDYQQLAGDPSGLLLVAEREGWIAHEILGFAACYRIEAEAEIWNIAVGPAHRRRGVARALLRQTCQRLSDAGVHRLFLEVRESNLPAIELYRSIGFAPLARRKDYYQNPREDALLLVLKFQDPGI